MSSSTSSNSITSSTPLTTTTMSTMVDVYSHDPDCKFEHPIPDSDTLDKIINSVIDSHSSSNTSIARTTREFIENTIHQPLHSLLIPSHKCKSPFAFHQHLSARTLFKLDYINIIHKEILSPKQKLSASPGTSNCINNLVNANTSSRPSSSGRNPNFSYPPSSPSSSSKTLDQEINILASLWGESSQEVKQVYEVLEKCSKIIHEYMFVANKVEKEREEAMIRIENADIYRSPTNSNLLNKQQRIIPTTDSTDTMIDGQIETNYESKEFQKKSD